MRDTDKILELLQDIKGMLMSIAAMLLLLAMLCLVAAPIGKICATAGLLLSLRQTRKYYDRHKIVKVSSETTGPEIPKTSEIKE